MKRIAVALLILGMLCNAALATAEGPVPFKALMQTAGAQPSLPPMTDAKDQSTAVSTQPAHRPPMSSGGKVMTGIGIGMLAIGGGVVVGTAALGNCYGCSSHRAELYGAGSGIMAGGAILVVLGNHRRIAQ
jgi:hypothetical protein